MESLYILVPLSVLLAFLIGAAFWRAVESGQFDDLEAPGIRILVDDDRSAQGAPANSGDLDPS